MALNSFLRRASASILALPIGVISSVKIRNPIGSQFWRFSTTEAGDDMLGTIESDYTAHQQSSNVQDGFPFKIEHLHTKRLLFLERQLGDENIRVTASYHPRVRKNEQGIEFSVEVYHSKYNIFFNIHALPDEMVVRNVSLRGNLKAFNKFWENRGMTTATTNFLFDYYKQKDELECKGIGVKLLPGHTGVAMYLAETPEVIESENTSESCNNSKPN